MHPWDLRELIGKAAMEPLRTGRGGYTLTMRECQGAEEVLARLAAERTTRDAPGSRLHLGWGSFRNLDIVAARRSAWALLLDVNLHQFEVWDAVFGALAAAPDGPAFIEALLERLPTEPPLRQFAADTRRWLTADRERPGSWLYRDAPERYSHVKRLLEGRRVATGCVDLRGGGDDGGNTVLGLARRVELAEAAGYVVFDTLYVSNIPWMLQQPVGFFGETHADHLPADAADVGRQVRSNLLSLASRCRWVISAARLRSDATPDNLHWTTELLSRGEFP